MSLMMADCIGFQAQIASIIELLANSAVVEICKLVDDGYAALRSQMDQEREKNEKENDALRHRLREMDLKMRSYERKMRRRNSGGGQREEASFNRPPEASCDVFPGTEDLQARVMPVVSEDIQTFQHMAKEDVQALPLVKQENVERSDCNLDLKEEVNIGAECGLSSDMEANDEANSSESPLPATSAAVSTITQTSPYSTEASMDLTCRRRAKRKRTLVPGAATTSSSLSSSSAAGCRSLSDVTLKSEAEADNEDNNDHHHHQTGGGSSSSDVANSPDRGGGLNSLGLDLAWMQERVSHLGAAFAVAQLGLGNVDAAVAAGAGGAGVGGLPSAAFPSHSGSVGGGGGGGGADGLDNPPAMLFPGGAHEMAAFAASFDMASAAPPPAPPPPAPAPLPTATAPASTSSSSQMRAVFRFKSSDLKEEEAPPVAACAVCRRTFPSAAALELHARVHTGERPYSCPHCGKGFAQPNNLRVHLLIHSGERRYHCSLCGKSFISSSHLKRHRTVHTQEKPYTCSRCGQSFSQMCSVRRHRQQSPCGLYDPGKSENQSELVPSLSGVGSVFIPTSMPPAHKEEKSTVGGTSLTFMTS